LKSVKVLLFKVLEPNGMGTLLRSVMYLIKCRNAMRFTLQIIFRHNAHLSVQPIILPLQISKRYRRVQHLFQEIDCSCANLLYWLATRWVSEQTLACKTVKLCNAYLLSKCSTAQVRNNFMKRHAIHSQSDPWTSWFVRFMTNR
jgi:hypothetical protein